MTLVAGMAPFTGMGATTVVSTVSALQNAVNNLNSDDTILIEDGAYNLTATLVINYGVSAISNIVIRGNSGNRDAVEIYCPGMGVYSASAPHCFNIFNVRNLIIRDITAGKTYWHPISIDGASGAEDLQFINLRLVDAGEQFIKVNNGGTPKCDNCVVEGCLIEYTDYAYWDGSEYYTQGIDKIGGGDNWIVRDCIIRNIRPHPEHVGSADGVGAAITFWYGGTNSLLERNTVVNCRKGLEFGINDGSGITNGIIRNNFIYRAAGEVGGDDGIMVNDSPNVKVYNNTVIQNATFNPGLGSNGATIEYRWDGTTDLEIKNNLSDGQIWHRTGGLSPDIASNISEAAESWFIEATNADLHLNYSAVAAIDSGLSLTGADEDIDREIRPIGTAPDIGADEYNPDATDSDFDGMNDAWETLYFGGPTNASPLSDDDGDGHNNWEEYITGMIPTNATSVFQCLGIEHQGFPMFGKVIKWNSASNCTYNLTRSTNLPTSDFGILISDLPATPPLNMYTDAVSDTAPLFYQVEVRK